MHPDALSLGGDVSSGLQGLVEQGEVRGLEEGLGGSNGVGRVGDNDIVRVLVLGEELESVTDVDGDSGVLVASRHEGEVLLGDPDDGLVNVAEGDSLDRLVLEDLSDDTSVSSTDDEDVLGVGVRGKGQVGDHLLVPVFLSIPTPTCAHPSIRLD